MEFFLIPTSLREVNVKKSCQDKYVIFYSENNNYKGCIKYKCVINDNEEVYAVELYEEVECGTNGTFNDLLIFESERKNAVLIDTRVPCLEIDKETDFISSKNAEDIIEEKGEYNIGESVMVYVKDELHSGKVIHSGKIDGLFCYAVNMDRVTIPIKQNPCIVPWNAVMKKVSIEENAYVEKKLTKGKYTYPCYEIAAGYNKGIQGNLNSCYLDTTLFSIFTFNMFLDNMLNDNCDDPTSQELQRILRDDIIFPLRKVGFVNYLTVSKFRDKLQSLSPAGKFIINERDPEEFLEELFKLLTPTKFLLKTTPLNDIENVQNCFLTQIFYQSDVEKNQIGLEEMFTLSFLEFQMLIALPPKCLILQLPRSGRDLKKFKRVIIPKKLDITPFILKCEKKCKDCTTIKSEMFFCHKCSMKDIKLTYYCKDHKENCLHEKTEMSASNAYKGSVVLELVSILCIEKTHYVTYVKTNNAIPKWIYFNSMEKIENGIFTPIVRDTKLTQYFDHPINRSEEYDRDIDKIENYAFICVYKNPTMEFYNLDFNTVV